MIKLSAFLGLALSLVACGGDDRGPGPVSMDTAQAGCQADCQHRIECGSTQVLTECTASCVADVTGVLRDDVFNDIVDCNTALACGASSDPCEALCSPTSTHDRYEAACRAVFAACPDAVNADAVCSVHPTGSNGDAGFFCYITPSIIDEFIACLPAGAACPAAIECMTGVADTHNIDL